jgi:general secretion pathway protein L
VPYSSGEWNAMMTDITIVRTGLMAGFACEPEQLSEWLEMLLSNTVPQPTRVQLHHYNDTVTSITHQVVPIENINHAPEQWITAMAMESLQAPALNLLQGSFAVKKPTFLKINKVWKIIAALVGAWIALIILYPIVSYAILKSHLHSVQGQMMQIYKHHFPQANHLLAPKVRMEEKLHQAMASVGEDHFLLSLAYVGKAFAQTPGVTLKHLEYQGDKLTLDVSAKTAEDFAAVTTYLTQQGLNVSQQNATMSGERIHAIIQIG